MTDTTGPKRIIIDTDPGVDDSMGGGARPDALVGHRRRQVHEGLVTAVELQEDSCPRLHTALHVLCILALDEVEAAEKERGEMSRARGIPEPGEPKEARADG